MSIDLLMMRLLLLLLLLCFIYFLCIPEECLVIRKTKLQMLVKGSCSEDNYVGKYSNISSCFDDDENANVKRLFKSESIVSFTLKIKRSAVSCNSAYIVSDLFNTFTAKNDNH